MKIVLLGYMASGKSIVGKKLAKKTFLPFIDLDNYIESKEKLTVSEIFKRNGEIYFRRIEHKYLQELLISDKKFVLSLGGGTPCYANNMDAILKTENVTSIYLQANINTLVARLKNGKSNRPLVKELSDEKLLEFVAKHVFERRFFYEQAHKKVVTDKKTVQEIITEIVVQLH